MSATVVRAKLLAVDVGLARIGIAVCDPLWLTVRPLTVIQRRSRREDFVQLARLVHAQAATGVICGLPLNMDGSEGPQAQTVRKWAERCAYALRAELGHPVPLIFWDERLSTFDAQEVLSAYTAQMGAQKGAATGEDAAAAAVILQRYLDAQRQGDSVDYGAIHLPSHPSGHPSSHPLECK